MPAGPAFPGFADRRVDTRLGRLFVRLGGAGPPLVLLHGFPQTGHAWRHVAPKLAERFSVIVPDLPGYGASDAPKPGADGTPYDKRAMALAICDLIAALGHRSVRLAGHDRGGRVAYRLALDHPSRVEALALVDIAPTHAQWDGMDAKAALASFHWPLMAQPPAVAVPLLAGAPDVFFGHLLDRWAGHAGAIDAAAREVYLKPLRRIERIAAVCADYRAGAGLDVAHDRADLDAGRRIAAPSLAVWGRRYLPASPLPAWKKLAETVRARDLDCGHFLAEEDPNGLLAAFDSLF